MMKLKLMIEGKQARQGQEVTSFKGKKYTLLGWKEPTCQKDGRVYVIDRDGVIREMFPAMICGVFILE